MESIVLKNVTHHYPTGSIALNNISVSFPANKITVIVGRSGSGKSTLLQVVNGLIKPDHGTVSCLGNDLDYKNINESRRKIGYVVQGIGLFPHLTVKQNISLASAIAENGNFSVMERVDLLMKMLNLKSAFKDRFPDELSGGEQQRVGICRALFNKPEIILMDEPLGSLDAVTRNDIQKEVLNLQRKEGQTMLFVTHDLREASKLADYILVLDKGTLQQFGTKDEVLSNPTNKRVKDLIEASL
jgi:osmoprotectant transport system ATP-binding protein